VTRRIPPVDLMWLLGETADSPTHVGGVMLFERPVRDRTDLVANIVRAYRAARPLPPFNLVPELVTTGLPHWRRIPQVDLDYHVRHLLLPPGASEATFLRLIEDLHEPMLDRNRPGFRVWLIEGLADDRFALYFKVHHSIIDGLSAMVRIVASLSPAPRARPLPPFYAVDVATRRPRHPRGLIAQLEALSRAALEEAGAIGDVSLGLATQALRRLLARRLRGSQAFAASDLPLNAPLRAPRSFAMLALPLGEMRALAHAFGGTINDVAAASVDAGLHRYLAGRGTRLTRPLVAMCPVSLRDPDDTAAATKATAIFVPLGAPGARPAQRMQQVVAALRSGKDDIRGMSKDAALVYGAAVLGLGAAAEFVRVGRLTGHVANFVLSNISGAREPRYLGGARLRVICPVSALGAGIGLNVTLASHDDTMGLGFVGNRAALPDLAELARHTRAAFAELRAAVPVRRSSRRAAR
jgi:diacylglycerol O-acyltransferase